jgi:hypothetical protein
MDLLSTDTVLSIVEGSTKIYTDEKFYSKISLISLPLRQGPTPWRVCPLWRKKEKNIKKLKKMPKITKMINPKNLSEFSVVSVAKQSQFARLRRETLNPKSEISLRDGYATKQWKNLKMINPKEIPAFFANLLLFEAALRCEELAALKQSQSSRAEFRVLRSAKQSQSARLGREILSTKC